MPPTKELVRTATLGKGRRARVMNRFSWQRENEPLRRPPFTKLDHARADFQRLITGVRDVD